MRIGTVTWIISYVLIFASQGVAAQDITFQPISRRMGDDAAALSATTVARVYAGEGMLKLELRLQIDGFGRAIDAWTKQWRSGAECGTLTFGTGATMANEPDGIRVIGAITVQHWTCSTIATPIITGFPPKIIQKQENIKTLVRIEQQQFCYEISLNLTDVSLNWSINSNCGMQSANNLIGFAEGLRVRAVEILRGAIGDGGLPGALPSEAGQFEPAFMQASAQVGNDASLVALVTGSFLKPTADALNVLQKASVGAK